MINGHSLSIYICCRSTNTQAFIRTVNIRYFITRTSFITIFLVFIPINIRMCEKHVKPPMTRYTNAKKKTIRTSTYTVCTMKYFHPTSIIRITYTVYMFQLTYCVMYQKNILTLILFKVFIYIY